MDDSSILAWTDVDTVETISLSSLDIDSCVDTPDQVNQICLPPELLEKIVCYFDGKTLLKFKQLSKTCNDIANNALRYNKLWKKYCLGEIPKKYLIDMFTKQCDKNIPFESLLESHYEAAYKKWIQWQNPVFKLTCIGQHNFLGLNGVVKIVCHELDVMIVFPNFMYSFTVTKNQISGKYYVLSGYSENCKPGELVVLNPRPVINRESRANDVFITCHEKHSNLCPLHDSVYDRHDGNMRDNFIGKLVDVDMNAYTNVCCWVRETWYEWHSNIDSNVIMGHLCPHLSFILFTSVIHGLIISRNQINSILIHGIFKDTCIISHSWLKDKYSGTSAIYMYTNILFVGTLNGFLLAYRLRCMDDLINLKDRNMLLEIKLDIGQIIMFDIIDFDDVKVLVVAATNSVLWFKIE
ncbi:uncharacterized protein LOC100160165 [Acyrthosiphon pisum]|uniref:F-box domain-containing protein n=1 Tax=Acyrthosiphon pisum TaxID=7029 RepID=A0A8R1VZA0_ACYPI|nr:uncharacterized protein LOC100160165 [Acyrthosiphon pisum]|eukprot:XP_001944728.1 PREDICTED: uncharacterized protein LOC100160165 [Acyrthosiphon pisum]